MYFSYKQAKLVRAVEPKSKIWGVLGGYPLITGAYSLSILILPLSDRVCSLVDSSGSFLFPLGTIIDRPFGHEIRSSRLF